MTEIGMYIRISVAYMLHYFFSRYVLLLISLWLFVTKVTRSRSRCASFAQSILNTYEYTVFTNIYVYVRVIQQMSKMFISVTV